MASSYHTFLYMFNIQIHEKEISENNIYELLHNKDTTLHNNDNTTAAEESGYHMAICIDVGTGGHWGHVPPRFCNKQRSALLIFRKSPLFLKKKVPSKCRAPPSLRCFLRPWLLDKDST